MAVSGRSSAADAPVGRWRALTLGLAADARSATLTMLDRASSVAARPATTVAFGRLAEAKVMGVAVVPGPAVPGPPTAERRAAATRPMVRPMPRRVVFKMFRPVVDVLGVLTPLSCYAPIRAR
jgi:hypothetical protein